MHVPPIRGGQLIPLFYFTTPAGMSGTKDQPLSTSFHSYSSSFSPVHQQH